MSTSCTDLQASSHLAPKSSLSSNITHRFLEGLPARSSRRAPKTGKIPIEAWEPYKDILKHLYLEDNKTLKAVQHVMKEKHGFDASLDQYKSTFGLWRFKKNLDKKTRLATSRVEKGRKDQNPAKQSQNFFPGGKEIPQQRLTRFKTANERSHENYTELLDIDPTVQVSRLESQGSETNRKSTITTPPGHAEPVAPIVGLVQDAEAFSSNFTDREMYGLATCRKPGRTNANENIDGWDSRMSKVPNIDRSAQYGVGKKKCLDVSPLFNHLLENFWSLKMLNHLFELQSDYSSYAEISIIIERTRRAIRDKNQERGWDTSSLRGLAYFLSVIARGYDTKNTDDIIVTIPGQHFLLLLGNILSRIALEFVERCGDCFRSGFVLLRTVTTYFIERRNELAELTLLERDPILAALRVTSCLSMAVSLDYLPESHYEPYFIGHKILEPMWNVLRLAIKSKLTGQFKCIYSGKFLARMLRPYMIWKSLKRRAGFNVDREEAFQDYVSQFVFTYLISDADVDQVDMKILYHLTLELRHSQDSSVAYTFESLNDDPLHHTSGAGYVPDNCTNAGEADTADKELQWAQQSIADILNGSQPHKKTYDSFPNHNPSIYEAETAKVNDRDQRIKDLFDTFSFKYTDFNFLCSKLLQYGTKLNELRHYFGFFALFYKSVLAGDTQESQQWRNHINNLSWVNLNFNQDGTVTVKFEKSKYTCFAVHMDLEKLPPVYSFEGLINLVDYDVYPAPLVYASKS